MTTQPLLPLSITALALILIGTTVFTTTYNTPQPAFVASAQTVITPTFTREEVTVQEGQTARLTITLPEPVTKTTRVQFTVTPGTAKANTDYVRPTTQTVTFYKNGLTSKTISVRTRTDRVQEGNETFSVNITRVDGKALATPESALVTITERAPSTGSVSTPSGTTAPVKDGVETRPVTGVGTVSQQPTSVSPRCTPQQSTEIEWPVGRKAQWRIGSGGFGNGGSYAVGTSYHFSGFTLPVDWDKKFREIGVEPWERLWQMDGAGPKAFSGQREYLSTEQGAVLYDLSISECPGDFSPQTSCSWPNQQAGTNMVFFRGPTTDRNFYIPRVGPLASDNTTCELQGGKTYYMNVKFRDCFGAPWCSGGNDSTTYRDPRLPTNLNEQGLLNAGGSTDFIGGMIYASGLVSRTEVQRLRQIEVDARQCRATASGAQTLCGANGCVADPNAVAACDQIFNRPWRDAGR